MKEYNELLFEATCHAASGFLANPRFSGLNHSDIARSAIVAGKEIVKQYQAEVKKDDYVTDDGMRLGIGDKYYQVHYHFSKFKITEQTIDNTTYPFAQMKGNTSSNAALLSANYPVLHGIYGNKETAEQKIASDSTKNDSK